MTRQPLVAGLLLLLPSSALVAQVPVGEGVRFSTATGIGIDLVNVATGASTPIVGMPSPYTFFSAGTIDPITGDLWVSGLLPPASIATVSVSGSFGTPTDVVTTSAFNVSLDFDRNGNVYACDAAVGELIRIARDTGQVTNWDLDSYPGLFNSMCIDMEADRMYVATFDDGTGSVLIEYDLSAGPGPGTVLTSISALGFPSQVSGCDDDGAGTVYVSTFDAVAPMLAVDVATGLVSQVGTGQPNVDLRDVWYERTTGLLHAVGGGAAGGDDYYILDPTTGLSTQVTQGDDVGAATAVAVNDFLDRTEVFPQRPSAASAFTLETAAHGQAGDFAGVAVVAINGAPVNPIVLGLAACDGAGFASFEAPVAAGSVTAGDQYTLLSARVDAGGQLHLGTQVEVIVQP